ncbi:hypothetical protein [Falsiroseomonas sp. E2-1-a20]|uniref:hypothetical protein n=1 Tax=Falsiroseomonas sp. E2-1-a20 TaxID=3239300 RepID=UPI003F353240
MMSGYYEEWRLAAAAAALRALTEQYPRKPEPQRRRGAQRIADGVVDAVSCYSSGASAALLDVLEFCRSLNLPLPPGLDYEVQMLSEMALSGKSAPSSGQGGRFPLDQHRNALERRRRREWVRIIREMAEDYADADDPDDGALSWGAVPDLYAEWQVERPEADGRTTEACKIAARRHGDGMREWRAFYDAFAEVETAATEDGWPGIYYIPSPATAARLDLAPAIEMQMQMGLCDWPGFDLA